MIRLLTAADAAAIQPLIDAAYAGPMPAERLFDTLVEQITVGDPAIPTFCRLIHSHIDSQAQIDHFPPGLAQLIRQAQGHSIQVAELAPLPLRDPGGPAFIAATMLPLLATALRAFRQRFPATAQMPVWANLDPGLALLFKTRFPLAQVDDRFIWMDWLQRAAQAVDAEAQDV